MADESANEEKTEILSQRRLKEAWDQGKIPVGREATGVAALIGAVAALVVVGPRFAAALVELTSSGLRHSDGPLVELFAMAKEPALLAFLVVMVAALAATAVVLAQTRGGLWPELALPDPDRLAQGRLTRAFTKEFAADMGLMVVKVVVVGTVAMWAVRDDLLTLPRLLQLPPEGQLAAVFAPLTRLAVRAVAALAFFAGAELALTHLRFRKKLKMTREEAKREHKEDEGDPIFRSRRRKRAKELAKGRVAIDVPRADAIVVNPTHVAVAIRYRKDEGQAPRVIAKGKGQIAENIRDLARGLGIPIVEDITLARLLYKRVKVGGVIPAETYKTVAAILAFVYRVTGRRPEGQRSAA